MIKHAGPDNKRAGKSRFTYHERTIDDVKRRAEQTGGRFDSIFRQGVDVFRPKVGENLVRILPPTWEEHDHYGYDVWVHARIGQDNSDYLCLRKMNGAHCPICDASDEAKEGGETDEAKALQANKKVVMWLIDRDENDAKPMLWLISWMADRDVAALCHDTRKGKVWLLDHPDDGYDLIIRRTGQGLMTRYTYQLDRDTAPIDTDAKVQDEVLDYITENPIPSVLLFREEAYLTKVLAGAIAEKDEDLDEDKPRGRRARDEDEPQRRSRRARDEDDGDGKSRRRAKADEDEEDEVDDDADEEEEKKPVRRRQVTARDDDEDEDEKPARRRAQAVDDDADEEEEEKPARRRRARDEDEEEDAEPPRRKVTRDNDRRPHRR